MLKGLFPFFATFLHELGFDLGVHARRRPGDAEARHRGGQRAVLRADAAVPRPGEPRWPTTEPDFLFLPMLRSLPRVERRAARGRSARSCRPAPTCCAATSGGRRAHAILSPVIDVGPGNLRLARVRRRAAGAWPRELGVARRPAGARAYRAAVRGAGAVRRALPRARPARARLLRRRTASSPVVVLGRAVHHLQHGAQLERAGHPARAGRASASRSTATRSTTDVPVFEDMYWGYGQRNLRAAHQIRRTPGVYSLYCSNYSCGPDSFNLHFYAYIMEGKPFAVIETDGHSGDAGTKTRVEAFLHCVAEDKARSAAGARGRARLQAASSSTRDGSARHPPARGARADPAHGPGRRGAGRLPARHGHRRRGPAHARPRDACELGRRHTSGKECVPMCLTLGSLLQRLERERDTDERFVVLHAHRRRPVPLRRLQPAAQDHRSSGWAGRTACASGRRLERDYFDGVPAGLLRRWSSPASWRPTSCSRRCYDVRPVEAQAGRRARALRRYQTELAELLEREAGGDLSPARRSVQVASGRLFGCPDLLARAASDLPRAQARPRRCRRCCWSARSTCAAIRSPTTSSSTSSSSAGIRVRLAPFNEWLEYTDYINLRDGHRSGFTAHLGKLRAAPASRT